MIRRLAPALALLAPLAASQSEEPRPEPISGIRPELALFNSGRECGVGAVAVWAGRLWAVTYSPHAPGGSDDGLYEIDAGWNLRRRPESVGGTPANRMVHRESSQLVIGPYFIDSSGGVRVIPPERMPGRLTATARHLSDPANRVYFFTMEEGLYDVDVHTLEVMTIHADRNAGDVPDLIPGYHGKGGYTGQGRLVVSNNGERGPVSEGPAGCLAEWDGESWRTLRREPFCEVTGPGGIEGDPGGEAPLWASGWDERSVLLQLLAGGRWSTYRLPKANYTGDARHGWYTEWPRIRRIGADRMLMSMHGMLWDFPPEFGREGAAGIRPLSSHLKMVVDFCEWSGGVVLACNDASRLDNPLCGQSQSNLWMVDAEQLGALGPRAGFGGVWAGDPVEAGRPSEPFLFTGFERRVVHLTHDRESPVTFGFEVDVLGTGRWRAAGSATVPPAGYVSRVFPRDLRGEWIRVTADRDCDRAWAFFHLADADPRALGGSTAQAGSLALPGRGGCSIGVIRPRGEDLGTLHFAAWKIDPDGEAAEAGYYEIGADLRLRRVDDPQAHAWLKDHARIGEPAFRVDRASAILSDGRGGQVRLPRGHPALEEPTAIGWPRGIREVVTERSLLECLGTLYELPRPDSGGIRRIRPICTHDRLVFDFCSWRGLLVIAGASEEGGGDPHHIRSDDGEVALWLGTVDDLWGLGKPRGRGGPWLETPVEADRPSDPYLMYGFDRKSIELSHDSDDEVTFTLEVDFLADGSWHVLRSLAVPPGAGLVHELPDGYSAHWVRVRAGRACTASAQLDYR